MINFPKQEYHRMSDVICIYFTERASLNEYLFYETYSTYVARQIYYRYLWNHFSPSVSHFLLKVQKKVSKIALLDTNSI